MSNDYKVPYTVIKDIKPHPGADRLAIATVYGWQVVVPKDRYKVGDTIVYVPIDSILSPELEATIFGPDSKIKLHKSRVRQIRIRSFPSQGMVIDPKDISKFINLEYISAEQDLAAMLGITKYEPPAPGLANTQGKDKQRNKDYEHPLFHKYNGLDNIKWFPELFQPGDEVVLQEKLHGTNARASLLPYRTNTLFRKLLKFLKLAPNAEQCYGSNNVQKAVGRNNKHFYDEDVWGSTFKKLDVFSKLKLGETVFGEIIGPAIQANYTYGLKEPTFVLFDVKRLNEDGKQTWLKPDEVEAFAKERGFEFVPVLYRGPFNKELTYQMTSGPSVYCPAQKVREGLVIKAKDNYDNEGNKRALKYINEAYLDDKTNTDNH